MKFNSVFFRSIRFLLFPFSLLYGLIIIIRNWLYNKKIFRCASFNLPVICVGNLVMGGTGKSPMVEYLIALLKDKYHVATISRGYKRKTKGYTLANDHTTALEIGDEPMQFHTKFPEVAVAVGEERVVAVPQLLHDKPGTEVIILDDAFQHRAIKAGLNILLTECDKLFVNDFFFPTGYLRDEKNSAKRADIIIVTKCPLTLSENEREKTVEQLQTYQPKKIFFVTMQYGTPYHIITKIKKPFSLNDELLVVYGIANPQPLKKYIAKNVASYSEVSYSDHHIFSIDDLRNIKKKFEEIHAFNKIIITTEKDAVRLIKFKEQLTDLPLYVLPVQHAFLFNEEDEFNTMITDFMEGFKATAE